MDRLPGRPKAGVTVYLHHIPVKPLSLIICCPGPLRPAWEVSSLKALAAAGAVTATAIVTTGERPARMLLHRYYKRRMPGSALLRPVRLDTAFPAIPAYRQSDLPPGTSPDLILVLGNAPLPGGMHANLGIVRLDNGGRHDLDDWLAFSPVQRQEEVTFVRMALDRRDGAGEVTVREACLRTARHSVIRNSERLARCCAPWLQDAVRAATGATPVGTSREAPCGVPDRRRSRAVLLLFLRLLAARLRLIMRNLFLSETWNIGTLPLTPRELLGLDCLPPVRWLEPLEGTGFRADPCFARIGGRTALFYEHFDAGMFRGRIDCLDNGTPRTALDDGTHLSYPFCLVHEGSAWCIPESCGRNEVALYRIDPQTLHLRKEAVLIDGFDGIDNTVFPHQGRWWMFSTQKKDEGAGTRLMIHHAGDLSGPWRPHAANPVKTDIRSARPAGTPFVVDGVLYRPAQDSRKGYGARLAINRIDILTAEAFAETTVRTVAPPASGGYTAGFHTINFHGDTAVVDGKRLSWSLAPAWRMLRHARRHRKR